MHQFVQSAIEAAKQGDKNKAMSFLKEVLAANPRDVDAWLVLAAVVDEPQRKRQCLRRVLALDPVNRLAREELFEMDRAEMGYTPPFTREPGTDTYQDIPAYQPDPEPEPLRMPDSRPATRPTPTQPTHVTLPWDNVKPAAKPHAAPSPRPASKPQAEKPQVFRYSTVTRILIYILAGAFLCSFLLALQDVTLILFPFGASFLILPAVWIVSAQVELTEKGIRASHLFGLVGSGVGWSEIARIQSKRNSLALITKKGNKINITTQVVGYPAIVEALRQKRPDLFGATQSTFRQSNGVGSEPVSPSFGYEIPAAPPSFSGSRTFKKSFFKQYGILLLVLPFGLLSAWMAFAEPEYRLAAGISTAFCFIMVIVPFFQIGSVKVEPNKLTVESFFSQKEFSARGIREIKMDSVRGRYGRITNFVNIITSKGRNYPLQGFKDGDEIIYGILHQWWESYRNR